MSVELEHAEVALAAARHLSESGLGVGMRDHIAYAEACALVAIARSADRIADALERSMTRLELRVTGFGDDGRTGAAGGGGGGGPRSR